MSYAKPLRNVSICVSAILLAGAALWIFRAPSADARAREMAEAIRSRNWRAIYELASDYEKSRQNWNGEQFHTLMEHIATHSLREVGPIKIEREDLERFPTSKNMRLTFIARRPGGRSKEVIMTVPFKRGPEAWHPIIYRIPIDLHNLMDRPTKDSLRILAEGCRKAGIDALARMDDHLVLSIDRLEEYLAGKREWNAIYTHRGGPHSREWVFGR